MRPQPEILGQSGLGRSAQRQERPGREAFARHLEPRVSVTIKTAMGTGLGITPDIDGFGAAAFLALRFVFEERSRLA